MKIFIIAALAMAALASADEQNFKNRMEEFKLKKDEFREKWSSMTEEERQKVREEHLAKRPNRPVHQFKDIPEEVRQKMKEKFESLSTEERQKIHDRMKLRFADGARAYGPFEVKSTDSIRSHFDKLSDEKKQAIREKLEKLTPEQREEIRKLANHQQIPAIVGPVPASADGLPNVQNGMAKEKWVRDLQHDRRNPRFPAVPASADGDFQKIRNREDDILIREKWVNELQANKKKPRL